MSGGKHMGQRAEGGYTHSNQMRHWKEQHERRQHVQKRHGQKQHRLAERQRQLVRENIGLVTVHLRRCVRNLSVPRRDREWEDLFQEGCLGLMQAAAAFQEERGIPFAAFALPRIHNAISRALQSKFSTVYVPPKRSAVRGIAQTGEQAASRHGADESEPPRLLSLSEDIQRYLHERRRHDPRYENDLRTTCETVGERLRGKYERAVRSACETISRKSSTRGDRDRLVRILMEERYLIPHVESRRPLRQIARETHSSYARVAQCDKQIGEAVRDALQTDPEFKELQRRARTDPLGPDLPIDDEIEHELAEASADEFARRFGQASTSERASMLEAVLALSHRDVDAAVRAEFLRLSREEKEQILTRREAGGRERPCRSGRPRQVRNRRSTV